MYPIIPHLASECLELFKEQTVPEWPEINKKYLQNKTFNIVVQINGKKRGIINCDKNIIIDDLIIKIKENKDLKKYFENKEIIKKFYVENKLINFIIK